MMIVALHLFSQLISLSKTGWKYINKKIRKKKSIVIKIEDHLLEVVVISQS